MIDFNTIENLYINAGYFKRYGLDIFITIIIIIIMLAIFAYFNTLNNLQIIRANWDSEKCNPVYFPYVPLINPDKSKTPQQQISDHVKDCINEGIKDITNDNIKPFFGKLDFFNTIHSEFGKFMSMLYSLLKWLIGEILYLINIVLSLIQKTFSGFIRYIQTIRDIIHKLYGVLVTNIFILLEVFNLGMAIVLNMAVFATITVMTPLIASFLVEFTLALGFFLLADGYLLSFFLAWLSPAFYTAAAVCALSAAATLVLIILVGIVMIALVHIENDAHRKATISSVGKMQQIPNKPDYRAQSHPSLQNIPGQ